MTSDGVRTCFAGNLCRKEMSSRTVKFSDLLTRPAEFAPLDAPPSPSSQLDTLSTTDSDTEEESPSPENTAETSEATTPSNDAQKPGTALKDAEATVDSSPPTLPTAVADASAPPSDTPPASTPPSDSPPVTVTSSDPSPAVLPSSAPSATVQPTIAGAQESKPPTEEASPSSSAQSPNLTPMTADAQNASVASLSPSPEDTGPPNPSTTEASPLAPTQPSLPSTSQAAVPSAPPLPEASAPGSIFNLPGLQTAFPMQPTSLQGFSVVALSEAEATARLLGLKTPKNFSVPSVSRLPDGSVILASPTTAVSMARIGPACSAALGNAGTRPLTEEIMGLVEKFRRAPNDDAVTSKLADALRKLQKSDLPSCDPAFAAALSEARGFFGKLNEATSRKTAAELTYLKHVEEFRSMKKDLRALSDVVQADGKAVVAARDKVVAMRKKNLPEAGARLFTVSSKLQQLRDIASRLH